MEGEIAVALIGLAGSCAGSAIGVLASARLTNYRLKLLEEKQDKHNRTIERTYDLERLTAVLAEDMKVVNHRLEDLEKFHKPK